MALVQGGANPGVYGSIYIDEGATAQAVANGATDKVTGFSLSGKGANGPYKDTVPDYTNDQITLTHAGVYLVQLACSYTSNGTNVKWEVEMHDAGGKVVGFCGHDETSTNGVGHLGFANLYTAAAGAVLTLYVKHNSGSSKNFTPVDVQFLVERIKMTA